MSVQEDIEVRLKRVRVLALEKCDRPRVLLTAEDQLGFLLTLRGGAPRGQRHREENRHDGQRNEQRRHGEAARLEHAPACLPTHDCYGFVTTCVWLLALRL